jgi:hypothetical protein
MNEWMGVDQNESAGLLGASTIKPSHQIKSVLVLDRFMITTLVRLLCNVQTFVLVFPLALRPPPSLMMSTGFVSPLIHDFDDTHSVASIQNESFIDFSQSSKILLHTRSPHASSGTVGSEDSAAPLYPQQHSSTRIDTNLMVRIYLSNSHFQPLLIARLVPSFPHLSTHALDPYLRHRSPTCAVLHILTPLILILILLPSPP